jgi:NitT/TauT family transport system permease protein
MHAEPNFYLRHERAILGTAMVVLFLLAWEGLERGWWADALRPLIGASAERWQLRPIFISSPTLVVQSAWRMFFVTGEIWRDLAWSGLGYVLGLALAIAIGIPLGLAAGWYRRFSYAAEPFLSALNATPQVAFLPLIVIWIGTGLGARVFIIFLLAVLPIRSMPRPRCAPPTRAWSRWRRASAPATPGCSAPSSCLARCRSCWRGCGSPSAAA